MVRSLVVAIALLALGACKIGDTIYQAPGDDDGSDGDAGVDAPPEGIHVQVSPGITTVSEGGQVTVQVRLSEAPPADRVVDIQGGTLLTPTPTQLTFTSETWNVNRTVILAAGQDADATDSPVTVIFNGNGLVADGAAMIMITDDDTMAMIVTPPSSLGITEGNTGEVQVLLTAQPASDVVISVATMDPAIATLTPGLLTFTNGNWNTPQTLDVTGVDDADVNNESTVLILDPAPEGMAGHSLAVNVTDSDVLGIDVTPSGLSLTEMAGAGHSGTINVRLTQQPPGDVTVDVVANPAAKVTFDRDQLIFTTTNFATAQAVVVTAQPDLDITDENVTVTLSAATLSDRLVGVAIQDDDTQVIQVTPTTVPTIVEGGRADLSVRLAFEPSAPVIVDVTPTDSNVANVDVAQLTFNPQDYATPQIVRVTATDDLDLADETTSISFNAPGLTTNRTIDVDDDDVQTLEVTPLSLAVAEGGQNTFTVQLRYVPGGNVTVGVATPNTTDIGVSPGTLMFNAGDFDQPRTVTVTGLQDGDVMNEVATVNVTSPGVITRPVTVNVSDDDALDIVVNPASIEIAEGDAVGRNLQVRLGAMPPGNVVVSLVTNPTGVASISTPNLTFTPQNYTTPQGVQVVAINDADGADESTTITLSAVGLADKTVPVTVTDDEVITPVLSINPVTIIEGKPNNQVTVRLNVDPGRVVFVEVPTFGFTDFEVTPDVYSFDSSNWNQPQQVTLFAYADDTADNEQESALFQIAGEGSVNLIANTSDSTILVGFPPPHGGNSQAINGLEAWRDGTLPQCWVIEKVAVDVGSAPGAGAAINVGLYSDGVTQPSAMMWESHSLTVGPGAGLRIIDIVDVPMFSVANGQGWIAVEATAGVTIRSKTGLTPHCSRSHNYGDNLPNPFNSSGSGLPLDGGPSTDGGVMLSCNDRAPVAVWLIARTDGFCVDPL